MQECEKFILPDGRLLAYAIYGSVASTTAVFYFHGFPTCRLDGRLWHAAAREANVRFICIDRPGMGQSSFLPNRSLLDWSKDVLSLANSLNIDKFYATGISGGAPYVYACCHAVPRDRL